MFLTRFALLCKIRTFPSDGGARLKTPDASNGPAIAGNTS